MEWCGPWSRSWPSPVHDRGSLSVARGLDVTGDAGRLHPAPGSSQDLAVALDGAARLLSWWPSVYATTARKPFPEFLVSLC